jgi:hypothetical protein
VSHLQISWHWEVKDATQEFCKYTIQFIAGDKKEEKDFKLDIQVW